jgi:hypothetical protein
LAFLVFRQAVMVEKVVTVVQVGLALIMMAVKAQPVEMVAKSPAVLS